MIERYIFDTGTEPEIIRVPYATGPQDASQVPEAVRKICEEDPDVLVVTVIRSKEGRRYIHQYRPIRTQNASSPSSSGD